MSAPWIVTRSKRKSFAATVGDVLKSAWPMAWVEISILGVWSGKMSTVALAHRQQKYARALRLTRLESMLVIAEACREAHFAT